MKTDITNPILQFLEGKEQVFTSTIFKHLLETEAVSDTRPDRQKTFKTLLTLRDLGALSKNSGIESNSNILGFFWTLIPTENK